jgi:hypothetical protein
LYGSGKIVPAGQKIFGKLTIALYKQTKPAMQISGQHEDNNQYDLPKDKVSRESKWLRFVRAYRRIPFLRRIDPVKLLTFFFIVVIETLLIVAFPPGNCTCEDQFTDQKLEALARQGDPDVRRYLAQKDNTINCAGRRKELLQQLEKKKKK